MDLYEYFKRTCGLEFYLAHAEIELVRPLAGGGGHPQEHKMTLFLEGGVAVAAKAGANAELLKRAKREVAAWVLASELSFRGLVPATVMRTMPVSVSDPARVEGSVQVLWPRFSTALEKSITASYIPEQAAWPIAVFDTLAANTDRAGDNWGIIEEVGHAVLIDHGHAFESPASTSEFTTQYMGQRLSPRLLSSLRRFLDAKDDSRLRGLLDDVELEGVFERADVLIKDERLSVRTP